MSLDLAFKIVIFVSAFLVGVTWVHRRARGKSVPPPKPPAVARRAPPGMGNPAGTAPAEGGLLEQLVAAMVSKAGAALKEALARRLRRTAPRETGGATGAEPLALSRPAAQIPLRDFDAMLGDSNTRRLFESVERRTRLSRANFERDCLPVLQAFAEFVQFLPASECHHHAQPGGLWIHALEVVDAALTFRAGMELPQGASTEERKRQEHRWTYAVFLAALLHDVGKPVTEVRVSLFGADAAAARLWAPMAGPMRAFAAHHYSVAFVDASARDYVAHTKLPGMLLHKFVPERVMRWLGEDASLLSQLVSYLSGDDPDGALGGIVKRADSDSVRRNLLQGPRTRFASARTVPLIERLMQALRRMLAEGALPLNRPGAAGWIHDGKAWFVCARLADEVRNYLAQHESLQGIPGKDRNDRLFDTWQEFGAALSAPDGGAVWRAHVRCEDWAPPEPFTLLCFRLEVLYRDASQFAQPMRGAVTPVGVATPVTAAAAIAAPEQSPVPQTPPPVVVQAGPPESDPLPGAAPTTTSTSEETAMEHAPKTLDPESPNADPVNVASVDAADREADTLPAGDQAASEFQLGAHTNTPQLSQPVQPRQRGLRPGEGGAGPAVAAAARPAPEAIGSAAAAQAGTRPGSKGPSPAAAAFMAWVAQAVGTGELRYNEDGALVHFAAEGALLLSPEIFRRFFAAHVAVSDGPIAALRQSHGDRAFARLQNELAKSGWTARNGDENLHYYAFLKADGSPSRTASFYLIRQPGLFWNPVPAPNARIRLAQRPKKMQLPQPPSAGGASERRAHQQSGPEARRRAEAAEPSLAGESQ